VTEKRCVRKDGGVVWARVNVSAVRNAQDEVQRTVTMCEDITARKSAEERLLLWSKLLERSAQAITITDAQAQILMVNRAFTEATDYTPEEACGQSPRLLRSGRHDEVFY
jgi:PAS domain-containing protein